MGTYGDPIVSPVDSTIGFNHSPLLRISREPLSGNYVVVSGGYYYQFSDSGTDFWLMKWGSSSQKRVLSYWLDSPSWSPDGQSIIFDQGGRIYSLPASGDSLDRSARTEYSLGGSFLGPKWNPAMTKLAVYGTSDWERGIWVWTRGTSELSRVIEYGLEPDWSPDGTVLVYHGWVDQQDAVMVADSLGANVRTLAKGFTYLLSPKFSPDGTKIAFIARVGNVADLQVWTVGADGSRLTQITTDGAGSSLAWTPSGREIVYVHFRSSEYTCSGGDYPAGTIWRVDPITRERHQITSNTGVECP